MRKRCNAIIPIIVCVAFAVSLNYSHAERGHASGKLAVPTADQVAWQDLEIGMFIHWGTETYMDVETDLKADRSILAEINPAKLDTDQWVRVAESMGAKYVTVVAKHHSGFCLWPTDTTDYSIKNTPWRGGKGDVVRDLAESCRKRGMKLGVYLSPADALFGGIMGGGGKTNDPKADSKYLEVYRHQLKELLTRYGEMMEVVFDGSTIIPVGDILKEYAPNAMIFQSKHATIRWVGNEDGYAPYPAWNAVSEADARSGVSTAQHGTPNGNLWLPLECDTTIRDAWFWNTENADTLKGVEKLMDIYYRTVGHGAVLLLNVAPDATGLIPEADAKRAVEFGYEVRRRFGKSVAETRGQGYLAELSFAEPTRIDHVMTMEDIAQGERVRSYRIEGFREGRWREICRGTAVGHKKIDRFPSQKVSKVRFRCTESVTEPIIRKFAAYDSAGSSQPASSQ